MKSAPPLPTSNRYQALSVDSTTNNESETCLIRAAQPSTPKIRKKKWERRLPAKYIIAADSARSLLVDVEIEATDSALRRLLKALIDCGATGLFIDTDYVRTNGIATRALSQPIPVYNVDGTPNEAGVIREVVTVVLQYGGHKERATFAVTKLGNQDMILGYTWLEEHNPEINWRTKEVEMTRCPSQCDSCRSKKKEEKKALRKEEERIHACRSGGFPVLIEEIQDEDDPWEEPEIQKQECTLDEAFIRETRSDPIDMPSLMEVEDDEEEEDEGYARIEEADRIFVATLYPEHPLEFIRASSTVSQRLAEAFAKNTDQKSFRDVVPASLHEFEDIFSKESFDTLPERRKWDHAIELQ